MDKIEKAFELTVADRINLLSILPVEGNIITLRLVREVREALSFSDGEVKALSLEEFSEGVVRWDKAASDGCIKTVVIGPIIQDLIKTTLLRLDKQNKLRDVHLDLVDRFTNEPKGE